MRLCVKFCALAVAKEVKRMRKKIILRHRNFNKQKTGQAKRAVILVGILALGLILLAGCRQKPKEVELEKKELVPLEEMVPLEPMAEEAPMVAEAPPAVAPTPAAPAAVAGKININTATQAQLETLPRIGPVTAQAIIATRPFSSIEDITRTPRIGPKTYENLRNLITVGGAAAPAVVPTVAPAVTPTAAPAEPVYKKVDTDGDGIPDTFILYQSAPAAPAPTAAPTVTAPAAPTAGKINVNTATQAQLETLPRIGPVTAQAIIAGRPYSSIEDLDRVPRIGPKTIENLRPLVTVK